MKITATFFLLIFLIASANSQSAQSIQFDRISQKKVRALLEDGDYFQARDFEKMEPACSDGEDISTYSLHSFSYFFPADSKEVWEVYKSVSPNELWSGRVVSFGLSYSRKHQKLIYREDDCGGVEEGQILISNLRYLGGFFKLAVAQEVTEINENERFITFCYMADGKTQGSQTIRIGNTSGGLTEVIHDTWYRSKSKFRDKKLYPGFHKKAIIELHENVERLLLARRRK